jgi:hypothetical protein
LNRIDVSGGRGEDVLNLILQREDGTKYCMVRPIKALASSNIYFLYSHTKIMNSDIYTIIRGRDEMLSRRK